MRRFLFSSFFSVFALFGFSQSLTISSGYQTGSYYEIAKDLQDLMGMRTLIDSVKIDKDSFRIDTTFQNQITVKTSSGSVQNFRRVIKSQGEILALMQQDVLVHQEYQDVKSGGDKTANVRYLLDLGIEHVHLITKADAKINSLDDLKRKKVGIGGTDQGTHFTAVQMQKLTGINWTPVTLDVQDCYSALLSDEIDAFFAVGAIPINKLALMSEEMSQYIKFVPVVHSSLEKDYATAVIKSADYTWNKEDVPTIGTKIYVVHNELRMRPEHQRLLTEFITKVYENQDQMKEDYHQIFKTMNFTFEKVNTKRISKTAKRVYGIED